MKKLTPHQELVRAAVLAAHANPKYAGYDVITAGVIAAHMPRVTSHRLPGLGAVWSAPNPTPATIRRVAEALGWEVKLEVWEETVRSEPFGRGYRKTRTHSALHIVRPTATKDKP